MDDIRKLTCIICPQGCRLEIKAKDGKVTEVSGYTCKRGEKYAVDEYTNPIRTCTTTVKLIGGKLPVAPVKTSKPVPKHFVKKCVECVNKCSIKAPVKVGDVVLSNILDTGADIVVTGNIEAVE